jgi:uncharacterized protein
MTQLKRPTFAELSRDDAIALLSRNHIGRLAFSFHDRVDIEPISYVYRDAWLYLRTSPGTKLDTTQHHPWVALEVDEVLGPLDWRSVVVRGKIYFLEAELGPRDRQDYDAAVEALQSIDPDALTKSDATPHRRHVFRIHVDEITGRQARSG